MLGTLIVRGEQTILDLIRPLPTLPDDDPRRAQILLQELRKQQQKAFDEQTRLTKAALAALKGKPARRKDPA